MGGLDLSGRKALVTGGAQGLGEGMAKALAAAGAKVVVSDLQKDTGEAVADALDSEYGAGNGFVAHDITDEGSWENAVVAANDILGGLDILVNNAGIEITSLLTEVTADEIRKMLEVNVLGTTLGLKWGLRTMRPNGLAGQGGAIINVASVAATIAFPGHRGLLRDQVRGRPAHPGRRDGVRQARVRRTRQLHLSRSGADRRWAPDWPTTSPSSDCSSPPRPRSPR